MRKSPADRCGEFGSKFMSTLKSCVKLLLTRGGDNCFDSANLSRRLIILGNGPSLKGNLEADRELLAASDTLAVNFAANSDEIMGLRPKYYVLADPHFFDKADTDPNVKKLIERLNSIDFDMTLFIPSSAKGAAGRFVNPRLAVKRFSFTAVEGFGWFENRMFDSRRGMPRPRNVLIPSLMIAIWLGYKEIAILGADHSWLKTLSVNDRNEVVSIQPHFYKEDDREVERVRSEYVRLPLHQVLESMMIAFRSYHRIRQYARERGVEIVNATPDSMIDAFPRGKI